MLKCPNSLVFLILIKKILRKRLNCSDTTCWGGSIYLNGFFFVQTILADRYIHRTEMWVVSLESSSSKEFVFCKILLNFVFFEELSRFESSSEHVIFGSLLFTFSVISVRINISIKKLNQNYLSRYKMHQFGSPNTRKKIKKTSSGLTGKFNIKIEIYLSAVFI